MIRSIIFRPTVLACAAVLSCQAPLVAQTALPNLMTYQAFRPAPLTVVIDTFDVAVYNTTTQEVVIVTETHGGTRKNFFPTFSPDGSLLITAEENGTVLVYEVATGSQLAELRGHTGPVRSVSVSRDGKRLVSVSMDLTGLVWDLRAILAAK